MLFAVTKLFVTVRVSAPAAKFTVPAYLLIVWFPVVPGGVIVLSRGAGGEVSDDVTTRFGTVTVPVKVGLSKLAFVDKPDASSASVVISGLINLGSTCNGIGVHLKRKPGSVSRARFYTIVPTVSTGR